METARELLEARAYARRRLTTAFRTGSPEVGVDARHMTAALVAGTALAALLIGGLAAHAQGLVSGSVWDSRTPRATPSYSPSVRPGDP